MNNVGIVVIGRNEGERLAVCLESLGSVKKNFVYVDSGSTDDSVSLARLMGIDVIELDMSLPFTAARARNIGFERLCQINPNISFIQFVDGDCEMVSGWFGVAVAEFEKEPSIGIICGRLRERCPEKSIYNLLCDMEWDTPIGSVEACGGIFMIRVSVFIEAGGFNSTLIAGEEPELCLRIRQKNWRIWRIKENMALHDANILHFREWWKRTVRGGYAFAEGVYMHATKTEKYCVIESVRIWVWGFFFPLNTVVLSTFEPALLMLFLIYPLQVLRMVFRIGVKKKKNWIYAIFLTIGKFAELQGQFKFLLGELLNSKSKIIEYKK